MVPNLAMSHMTGASEKPIYTPSHCCTKTAFSDDNAIYQQCDGVSMGSSLAPVLANIILTEFEKIVVTSPEKRNLKILM